MWWRDLSLAANCGRAAAAQLPVGEPLAQRLGVLCGNLSEQAVERGSTLVGLGHHSQPPYDAGLEGVRVWSPRHMPGGGSQRRDHSDIPCADLVGDLGRLRVELAAD
jgi:hypothetical protein